MPPAIILAAGRGNRLLPLTADRPKCLVEVGGKTLLEHQARAIRMSGVRVIQVVTGHGADRVHAHCNGSTLYAHNPDFDITNSLDSLGYITLEPGAEGILILNSDVLFHPQLLANLLNDPRENVLLADFRTGFGEEEMKIIVDESSRIQAISKSLDPATVQAENLGVLKLGRAAACDLLALARAREGRDKAIKWAPDGINFLRDRHEFYALPIGELPWTEIDFPEDLARAENLVYPLIEPALWG